MRGELTFRESELRTEVFLLGHKRIETIKRIVITLFDMEDSRFTHCLKPKVGSSLQ
jgi:hypothetical protein